MPNPLSRFFGRRAPEAPAKLALEPTPKTRRRVQDETHVERSVRTFGDWTPARLRQAQQMADSGSLLYAADLCDALFADDRVKGVLGTRVRGLLRLPIRFEPHEGEDPTPETEALEEDFWRMYPEAELEQLVAWGLTLGVGLAEQVWQHDDASGRLLPKLVIWHPRHLRFDDHAGTWRLSTKTDEIVIDPGAGKWILFAPYGTKRPWQHGLWRPLGLWWLLKRYAVQDWATYGEVHGSPLRVASEVDPSNPSSAADRLELAEDLQNLGGATAVALPPGKKLELIEATARTWETFEAQIGAANLGIAVAIAGQNLTSEVTGGSHAAANVHNDIRQDLIESDEQTLSTTLHYQGLAWWAAFNFAGGRAPWARWETTPEEAREIFQYHIENGIVTINEVRESLGLEPLEDGDHPAVVPGQTEALRRVKLASGADPKTAAGFVRGQLFIDALVDRGAGLSGLSTMLGKIREAVDAAETIDELRAELLGAYEALDPDDLGPLFETLMLADLAGRRAVIEDL